MKHLLTIPTILVLCLALSSCKKEKPKPEPIPDNKVDKVIFEVKCTGCTVQYYDTDEVYKEITNVGSGFTMEYNRVQRINIQVRDASEFRLTFVINGKLKFQRKFTDTDISWGFTYHYLNHTLSDGYQTWDLSDSPVGT